MFASVSLRLATAVVVCAQVAACATSQPQSLMDPRDPVPPVAASTLVALAPDIELRVEPLMLGDRPREPFRTGEIWRASFPAGDGRQRATLRIESTALKFEIAALGFAARYSYSVKAVLEDEAGKSTSLAAEGYQHTSMQLPSTPLRMAVIMALESIGQQATAVLKSQPLQSVAERLRALEALWRDARISEEEYRRRRAELLQLL